MRSRLIRVEAVQELLDAGHSPTKVANIMGVHHMYIFRMLQGGTVEIYKPFDEEQNSTVLNGELRDYSDWWCEDEVDSVINDAFDKCFGNLRDRISQETSMYLRKTYGGFFGYLRQRSLVPLADCIYKPCSSCGKMLPITYFSPNLGSFAGIDTGCKKCRYIRINKEVLARSQIRRRTRKRGLPTSALILTTEQYRKCELSGKFTKTHVDHFIPISIGHCGSYLGNLYALNAELNMSKHDANPFEWFEANGQRFELSQSAFDALVAKLAAQNGLTPEEFRDFTYWCFANKRTINQVRADNFRYGYKKPSLEIWREEKGLAFPIRVDFGDLSLDHTQETEEATAA